MRSKLWWVVGGIVAILGFFFVIGTVFPPGNEGLESLKGKAAAGPLRAALIARDSPALRFTCDESERILTRSDNTTEELEDWIKLAPICNRGLDGEWERAIKDLEKIQPEK